MHETAQVDLSRFALSAPVEYGLPRKVAAPHHPMFPKSSKPLVLIPCDNRMYGDVSMQVLYQRYSDSVRDLSGCLPIPLLCTGHEDIEAYLAIADGIMLPGSPSNVDPALYGQAVHNPSLPLDPARDATTLPLIRRAVAMNLPILAICRGLQEMNVALGGTLRQAIQELPGHFDHRGAKGKPDVSSAERYADAHPITIEDKGCLAAIVGSNPFIVNSVHGQGIDILAPQLRAEAFASDGQIEAISITGHAGFALGVQWHPEWQADENDVSRKLFAAFGVACRAWNSART